MRLKVFEGVWGGACICVANHDNALAAFTFLQKVPPQKIHAFALDNNAPIWYNEVYLT